MKNIVNTSGEGITRRNLLAGAAGLAMSVLTPDASAKEGKEIFVNNPSIAHRFNNIDNILRLKSSKSQERDVDGNRVLRIKMQTQEYVFAIGAKIIVLSRFSGGYNEQTGKREVRTINFLYTISTLGDRWILRTDRDTDNLTIMQHIGDIEQVLSKEFI